MRSTRRVDELDRSGKRRYKGEERANG
ncbi:hypothetical protein FOXYSP1_07469 [Fusarium oxysporum f. sp. phaseoli]